MKERIISILNIKISESKQVFDLLPVQFFIGLANAILNIVAFTLFIYDFSVKTLPYIYLAIALVLFVLNILYEKLEHKFSPLVLLKLVIGFAMLVLFVLWIGLSWGNKHDFIFALLVSSTIIYMLTSYAFWGLVSLLFNVRESRRVFSVVGSGDIPAKLIGYIAAPLLIKVIGLANLIWIAIFALITGLLLFHKVIQKKSWDPIRKKTNHETHHESKTGHKHGILNFFFKNKLIFTISLLSILSYNVFVLIDYTFISQVKLKFGNISDLAIYIASFFAIGRIIAITFKLIFTSRVIERLGIISCLFITPIALFLFCILFFVYQDHTNYNVFIFGIMALLTEVLRSTMQEPVFFILFQPLKEQLRLKGHIIAKGYTLPPSLIVVGLSLIFLFKWGISLTILFTIKIIIVNLFIWAIVIFFIQKAYLNTLHSSIKKGTFSSDENYIYDKKAIDILLNKIKTGKDTEVIYSLDLLKKAAYPKLNELLNEQLQSREKEIRKYALEQLEIAEKTETEVLKKLLAKENDTEVKQKIVSVLCKQDPDYLSAITEDLGNQEYDIRKIIIINLLNHQEFNYLFKAGNEINNLINSANPLERQLAISIITELKHVQFTTSIHALIQDPETAVKRDAVLAACKLKISSLLPLVLDLSNNPSDKHLVIKALQQYGDKLFLDIRELPKETIQNHIADLVKIAGNVKGEHCRKFLLANMNDLNHQTNKTIHALWIQDYQPEAPKEIETLKNLLNKYLKLGINKIEDHYNIPEYNNEKEIVKNSLMSEIKTDLIISLKICSLLFRKKSINRVLELIEIEKHQQLYNAIEMIELELPKKISKDLILLFDFILDPNGNKAALAKNELKPLFNKIYFSDSFSYNPWTKAIIMYCSWKNKITEDLLHIQQKKEPSEHYIITETRDFIHNTIN